MTAKQPMPPISTLHPFIRNGLVISAALVILTGSYLHWQRSQPASNSNISQPKKGQVVPGNIAIFTTEANPIRHKTLVRIHFQPPQQLTPIWMTLQVIEGAAPVTVLIAHPLFQGLDWHHVTDQHYSLFQHQPQFVSVTEFLRTPPSSGLIAVDPDIYQSDLFPPTKAQLLNLTELVSLEDVDFILTTYHPPFQKGDLWVSESIVDASQARLKDNKLQWQLNIEHISPEDPLTLFGIEVDYRQPKR